MQMIFTEKEHPKMFYLCNIMRELIIEGYVYAVSIIEDMITDDEFCAFIQYVHKHSTPKQLQIFYKVGVNF